MAGPDVVIVGGRCAGASLAIQLARSGASVCVVDRARFPSDVLSTHGIQPSGVLALNRLGVREQVEATTVPIVRAEIALGAASGAVDDVTELLGAPMLNVRRCTLDQILLDAAAAAGADVRPETNVRELIRDGDRITGIRTSAGDIEAAIVVGADGSRSTVARLVDAEEYAVTAPPRLFVWGYFDGVAIDGAATVWVGKPDAHGFLASPTDAGLFMAAATFDMARKADVLVDREQAFRTALREWPELEAVVAGGTLQGPLRAMANWRGFFRRSAGPGWALVGDAGHFKDPTPGQGIADAFRQSERLASAILDGLGGRVPIDEALTRWWHWRDADAWEMYWFAHDIGAAGRTAPLTREVQESIVRSPRMRQRLIRVLNHEVSPAAVATTGLVAGAFARSLARSRADRRRILTEARDIVRDELSRRRARPRASRGRVGRG